MVYSLKQNTTVYQLLEKISFAERRDEETASLYNANSRYNHLIINAEFGIEYFICSNVFEPRADYPVSDLPEWCIAYIEGLANLYDYIPKAIWNHCKSLKILACKGHSLELLGKGGSIGLYYPDYENIACHAPISEDFNPYNYREMSTFFSYLFHEIMHHIDYQYFFSQSPIFQQIISTSLHNQGELKEYIWSVAYNKEDRCKEALSRLFELYMHSIFEVWPFAKLSDNEQKSLAMALDYFDSVILPAMESEQKDYSHLERDFQHKHGIEINPRDDFIRRLFWGKRDSNEYITR